MMMIPRKNSFNLLDEIFNDPFFERGFNKKEANIMKTDVKEKDGEYILEIDIPGYTKDDIKIELENGYLTVMASKDEINEEKETNYIHKERFYGKCSRSYYVGEQVKEEEINAIFRNGILTLIFPKDKEEKIENKKYIQIGD